jgi:hypothetical protein
LATVPAGSVAPKDKAVAKASVEVETNTPAPTPAEPDAPPAAPPSPAAKVETPPATPELSPALVASAVKADPAASARPPAINPEKVALATPPRILWREGLERLHDLAQAQAKQADRAGDPWESRTEWLNAIERADEDRNSPNSALARSMVTVLAGLASKDAKADRTRAEAIRKAIDELEERVPLEINDLSLCQKVSGYGNYEPIDSSACKAGQTMIVYCEVSGLSSTKTDDLFHSQLKSQVALEPAAGGEPVWREDLGTAEDRCRHHRRDYFVNYRITIPPHVPAGRYVLRLTQEDLIAGRSATSATPVTVVK